MFLVKLAQLPPSALWDCLSYSVPSSVHRTDNVPSIMVILLRSGAELIRVND